MKIGIIGTGHIGKTLVLKLSAAGHDVKVANSRGPGSVEASLLVNGARAVEAAEAVAEVEVVILSIPLNRIPEISPIIKDVPADAVVIDTSNYYPFRDSQIGEIEAGQVESLWVANGSASLAKKGTPAGTPGRIAIPVAADRDHDRQVAAALIEDSGFDAFEAGSLADSWRQQPGAPAYCTDLTREEMGAALAAADKPRLPKRRDLGVAVMQERLGDGTTNPDEDWGVRLVRAINM